MHDRIVCIANPLAQLGLINLQMIDNTNDTTTFHSQLNTQRLLNIVPLSFEVKYRTFNIHANWPYLATINLPKLASYTYCMYVT